MAPKASMEMTECTNVLDLILQRQGIRGIREEEQKGKMRGAKRSMNT